MRFKLWYIFLLSFLLASIINANNCPVDYKVTALGSSNVCYKQVSFGEPKQLSFKIMDGFSVNFSASKVTLFSSKTAELKRIGVSYKNNDETEQLDIFHPDYFGSTYYRVVTKNQSTSEDDVTNFEEFIGTYFLPTSNIIFSLNETGNDYTISNFDNTSILRMDSGIASEVCNNTTKMYLSEDKASSTTMKSISYSPCKTIITMKDGNVYSATFPSKTVEFDREFFSGDNIQEKYSNHHGYYEAEVKDVNNKSITYVCADKTTLIENEIVLTLRINSSGKMDLVDQDKKSIDRCF